ncbi:MAG: UDP-glucose/GDP-mannose dehydrogenase family protein [bacterium]|nr:UDP-glucose/GDP-mannose dehydrogenase family protein [bacterium]
MKISVMGTGYVGLVTGTCFADLGNDVICADIDEDKIATLKRGESPIYEPRLTEMMQMNAKMGRLRFTTDIEEAVKASKVIFVAVGTPPGPEGEADLSQVHAVAEAVGKAMDGYRVVVNKSTVPVGTGFSVRKTIAGNQPKEIDFDVVSNPEFLREGSAIYDFMQPDRIVVGCTNREAGEKIAALYAPLNADIIITDIVSAELIKYASNAFLSLKISFINEIANICDSVGADIKEVVNGVGKDSRINPAFFGAGIGYGGSCFPKDTLALIDIARNAGCDMKTIKAAVEVNAEQRAVFVARMEEVLGDLKGKKIAVWGLSFKPNTDDLRESPAFDVIGLLRDKGAVVTAYDPITSESAASELPGVQIAADAYTALEGAEALVVATDWNMFKEAELKRMKKLMARPLVFDGRNIYDPEKLRAAGFEYYGVGRK